MKKSSQDKNPIGAMSPTTRGESARLAAFLNNAEWSRLPRSGQRDPVCSLSRSSLNQLILPCAANNYQPPVKSVILKKRYATRGIRLINVASLKAYLDSLVTEVNAQATAGDDYIIDQDGGAK